MSYATISDLRSQLGSAPKTPTQEAYARKQLHQVPDAPVVNRAEFVLTRCEGKRVLEFGASGKLHEAVVAIAAKVMGVDRADADGVLGFDLDDVTQSHVPDPYDFAPEIILCGEVLEHLGNPQWFLTRLRRQYPGVPVLITVPNAHSRSGANALQAGTENVNIDHVSWYSYRTLRTLLERVGYTMTLCGWYNGAPLVAEGLIVMAD